MFQNVNIFKYFWMKSNPSLSRLVIHYNKSLAAWPQGHLLTTNCKNRNSWEWVQNAGRGLFRGVPLGLLGPPNNFYFLIQVAIWWEKTATKKKEKMQKNWEKNTKIVANIVVVTSWPSKCWPPAVFAACAKSLCQV